MEDEAAEWALEAVDAVVCEHCVVDGDDAVFAARHDRSAACVARLRRGLRLRWLADSGWGNLDGAFCLEEAVHVKDRLRLRIWFSG